jgi:Hemerythrin HHE cation binding domain
VCEYCGCQAVPAIGDLTGEHDLVVDLIGEVRTAHAAADGAGMAALARQITAVLGPHTEVEERGLFPALAAEFPDHITALGEAATGAPADPAWPGRLLDAVNLLRRHILKEQDGVFPAALASLATADWEAIDAIRASVGTLLPSRERPTG